MAMLLRTSKRNVTLAFRVVCLLAVTVTFVVLPVSKVRGNGASAVQEETGN